MSIEATFPENFDELEQVVGKHDLSVRLLNISSLKSVQMNITFKIRQSKNKYMYAHCVDCPAKLFYKKQEGEDKFTLVKFHNYHRHTDRKRSHKILESKLRNLPENIKAADAYKKYKNEINLSRSCFYRIFNNVRNASFHIPEVFNLLNNQKQKVIGYYEPFQTTNPSLIIMSSPQMKNQFERFGQYCAFDITYHLIKEKSFKGLEYGVGFFVGLNNHNKIIPYAIVVTDEEHTQRMAKIFYQFFKLMGKMPRSIITDQQSSMAAGLNLLSYENVWQGNHYHDSFHILRNIRKKLLSKEKIQYFSSVIKAENELEFQKKVVILREMLQGTEDRKIIQKFLESAEKYCFAKVNLDFIGFTISSSICEKVNDLIKVKLPLSNKFGVVLKKCYELCTELIIKSRAYSIQSMGVQKFFSGLGEIAELKKNLCKKVFGIFLNNLMKSLQCLLKISGSQYTIYDENGAFVVLIQDNQIICNCGYKQKSGVPCLHILKIGVLKDYKLASLISKHWKITSLENSITARPNKRLKSKKTRRRTK